MQLRIAWQYRRYIKAKQRAAASNRSAWGFTTCPPPRYPHGRVWHGSHPASMWLHPAWLLMVFKPKVIHAKLQQIALALPLDSTARLGTLPELLQSLQQMLEN